MSPMRIELHRGDIVSLQADVYVSSIHRSKNMGLFKLSNHLLNGAGKSIQDEMYTKKPGKDLEIGEVEAVSSGKLAKCKELMFICLRSYIPDNEKYLLQSVLECLEMAACNNHKSIAIPALGVGQGYPSEKVANCLVEAIALHNYQFEESSLETAYIVMFDENVDIIKAFLQMCARGTTDYHHTKPASSEVQENEDLMSGLSFQTAHNINKMPDKSKVAGKAQMPKVMGQTPRAHNTGNKSSGLSRFMSAVSTLVNRQGLIVKSGIFTINVRPNISPKSVGVQMSLGIDISFIDEFIPSSLRTFWNQITH